MAWLDPAVQRRSQTIRTWTKLGSTTTEAYKTKCTGSLRNYLTKVKISELRYGTNRITTLSPANGLFKFTILTNNNWIENCEMHSTDVIVFNLTLILLLCGVYNCMRVYQNYIRPSSFFVPKWLALNVNSFYCGVHDK